MTVLPAEAQSQSALPAIAPNSEFLARLSHEMRTPLAAITGYLGLLESGVYGPVPEGQQKAHAAIQEASNLLLDIIQNALQSARVHTVQGRSAEHLNVGEIVSEAHALLASRFLRKRITFKPPVDGDLGFFAYHGKVIQILVNLIGNALKFTPEQGEVRVSADYAEGYIHISVCDTGPGIPAKDLETIFQPFTQAANNPHKHQTYGDEAGIGLGLAISQDLANTMGGHISVRNHPTSGAEFTLHLPC